MSEDYKPFELHDTTYITKYTRKYEQKPKYDLPDVSKVYAFIPGTITGVFVKEGDSLKKGDRLLELEAMKMRNRVEALTDGRVMKVHVQTGEKVVKGALLVEME